jgi:nucleotide-binding universal stress UspA family protein
VARIVVGVDASPGALRALSWAADEARLRAANLEVVHAYHAQALSAPLYFPSREALPGRAVAEGARPANRAESAEAQSEFEEVVRRQAEDLLEGLLGQVRESTGGIDVHRTVVEDRTGLAYGLR